MNNLLNQIVQWRNNDFMMIWTIEPIILILRVLSTRTMKVIVICNRLRVVNSKWMGNQRVVISRRLRIVLIRWVRLKVFISSYSR